MRVPLRLDSWHLRCPKSGQRKGAQSGSGMMMGLRAMSHWLPCKGDIWDQSKETLFTRGANVSCAFIIRQAGCWGIGLGYRLCIQSL